jgi:hypothetical protein
MFLGLLLAGIADSLIEIWLVNELLSEGMTPAAYACLSSSCYQPPYLQYGLLAYGLIGGYFLGQMWWRIVYVEKRHWSNRKK